MTQFFTGSFVFLSGAYNGDEPPGKERTAVQNLRAPLTELCDDQLTDIVLQNL